uniref:Uncharacterized protein n=1 Tax=Monodelphis domestica TaxID=13616 RepID=F7GAY3_MONDO
MLGGPMGSECERLERKGARAPRAPGKLILNQGISSMRPRIVPDIQVRSKPGMGKSMTPIIPLLTGEIPVIYNVYSVEENLQSLPKDYKMLLKKAFDPSLRKEVLDPKLNPLPADTDASRRRTKEDLHRTAMESKKSKVEELSDKLTKLTEMLQTHKEEVFSQKDGVNRLFWPNPVRPIVQSSPHHGKMSRQGNGPLGLILSDFHQLVTAFIHVFENELQDHCHRPAPHISPCGLLFQSVYETLTLFLQELKAVNEVTNTSEEVETKAEKPRREKAYLGGDTCMVTLVEKMKELKRIYEIFQDNPHTAGSKDGS